MRFPRTCVVFTPVVHASPVPNFNSGWGFLMNNDDRIETLELVVAGLLSEVCALKKKDQEKEDKKLADEKLRRDLDDAWQTQYGAAGVSSNSLTVTGAASLLGASSSAHQQNQLNQFAALQQRGNAATQSRAGSQNATLMASLHQKNPAQPFPLGNPGSPGTLIQRPRTWTQRLMGKR